MPFVVAAALVALVLSPFAPAHAGEELEAQTYSVTATEHWGYDYAYEGQTENFHWRDHGPGRLQAGWTDDGLALQVYEDGAEDPRFEFEFYPPEGEQLHVGEYTHVRPGHPFDSGRAGMSIEGTEACSQRFRILELDRAEDRAWLLFEAQCVGRRMNLSGEIRLNMPDEIPGLGVHPQAVSWPTYYRRERGETVPVRLVNRSAVPQVFARPRVVGATDAFEVLGHDCGAPLPPGDECTVRLHFTPRQARQVDAVLRVPRESGAAVEVPLDGRGYPGHTQLRARSSHYDDIGNGRDWTTRPLRERLEASPGWYGIDFSSPQLDGELRAGGHELGTPIPPGLYRHGDDAWLDVHRGFTTTAEAECGTVDGWFRVHEMDFGPQGLSRASVSFKQVCGNRPWAPLYGAFAWRASEPPPRLPSRVFVSYYSRTAVSEGKRVRGTVRLEKGSGPRRVKVVMVPTGDRSGTPRVLARRTLDGGEASRFRFRWKRGWRMSAVPGGRKPLVTATIVFGGMN